VEVMADDLGTFFLGTHIIADTHYELGNKLMKRFRHEKEVVFILSLSNHVEERRKHQKNYQLMQVSNFLVFQRNREPGTNDIVMFSLELSLHLAFLKQNRKV
jgi:hypothetical protein